MSAWRWNRPAATGQIALGIVGDTNIQGRDDPATAFAHVVETLREFEVLVGQWECPLTAEPPPDGVPEVIFKPGWRHSRPAMAEALTAAGFSAVSLASNVAYPPAAASETVRHLDRLGIAHAGVGDDLAKARAPALFDAPGARIALLSYTSVFWPVEQPATETSPGVATIRAHTSYAPGRRVLEMPGAAPEIHTWADPAELEEAVRSVKEAAQCADLVVVSCHWGVSSQEEFVQYQRQIAHALVDAGASIVYGTHPHKIQAIEVHNGAPIFYSLGNFAFDWEKMRGRHRDGLLVRCLVDRSRIVDVSFVPVRRGADNNVRILSPTGSDGAAVVARIEELSKGLSSRLRMVGDEVCVGGQ